MRINIGHVIRLMNIAGLIIGLFWFGWWFLIPGFMLAISYHE